MRVSVCRLRTAISRRARTDKGPRKAVKLSGEMSNPLQLFLTAKKQGQSLAVISLYDAPSAQLCCDAGCDAILVGDSMGNAMLGHDSTLPVTMSEMLSHTAAVLRGVKKSTRPQTPVIADLPFGSYATVDLAVQNAGDFMRLGAHCVKLEGAGPNAIAAVEALTEMGVPVMGHLGFTPQLSLALAGVVQGKTAAAADKILADAYRLERAGCFSIVLEAVVSEVAERITRELKLSTIGIGAGGHCDGQVLVWPDLAGMTPGAPFRFVKKFAEAHALLTQAAAEYVREVHSKAFPAAENGWAMSETELANWQKN